MESLFKVLCGALAYIGELMGLNYEQVSIFVCLDLWPAICTLTAILLTVMAYRLAVKERGWREVVGIVCAIFTTLYSVICIWYANNVSEPFGDVEAAKSTFQITYTNLLDMANGLGMTYEELNILIYVKAFLLINAFNLIGAFILYKLVRRKKRNDHIIKPHTEELKEQALTAQELSAAIPLQAE